jgi:ribosomal protein L34E
MHFVRRQETSPRCGGTASRILNITARRKSGQLHASAALRKTATKIGAWTESEVGEENKHHSPTRYELG